MKYSGLLIFAMCVISFAVAVEKEPVVKSLLQPDSFLQAGREVYWCDMLCSVAWVGDGTCQSDCNIEACDYDRGDCGKTRTDKSTKYCGEHWCLLSWVGDAYCDQVCNEEGCNYDGGDCK